MATRAPDISAGDVLRHERHRRRISLERASGDTRIARPYLEALEDGIPLGAFPAPVYAKFFLREYADYLHLDADRVVEQFTKAFGPVAPSPATLLPRKYADLGEEAIRVPVGIHQGRHVPLARAILPARRRPVRAPTAALDPTPPTVRMETARRKPSRALVLAGLVVLAVPAVALGRLWDRGGGAGPVEGAVAARARPAAALPLGGTRIFPDHRVVAFYGAPGTDRLGVLGVGPQRAAARLLVQAAAYERGRRPVLPAFELIATVASGHPGPDGRYRIRQNHVAIQQYLDVARDAKALMILDIQPGRSDFLAEARVYEGFLKEPDVGLAMDPEWHVGPRGVPGKVLGSVDADMVNRMVAYLSDLVKRYRLPQKLLVVHQFTADMVRHRALVRVTPQVAVTFDVDGVGGRAGKASKYQQFTQIERFHYGIKLYYEQDTDLMKPLDVLNLYPPPDLVVYQ